MPRKPKAKKTDSAATVVMETLNEQGADLKSAADLPAQLSPPEPVLEPLPRAEQPPESPDRINPAPEQARPRPSHRINGEDRGHAAAVLAERPRMQPTPPEFMGVMSFPRAGIRVNKSFDKLVAAIQFAETHVPSRAEKDLLEAVGQPDNGRNFVYRTATRQWERKVPDGMELGENVIDATKLATELARGREGRGR